eukprot:scaffold979_cov221-Pinguiococcus_pyrenoidosus.AAC.2
MSFSCRRFSAFFCSFSSISARRMALSACLAAPPSESEPEPSEADGERGRLRRSFLDFFSFFTFFSFFDFLGRSSSRGIAEFTPQAVERASKWDGETLGVFWGASSLFASNASSISIVIGIH